MESKNEKIKDIIMVILTIILSILAIMYMYNKITSEVTKPVLSESEYREKLKEEITYEYVTKPEEERKKQEEELEKQQEEEQKAEEDRMLNEMAQNMEREMIQGVEL